jgi:hypothetical protein
MQEGCTAAAHGEPSFLEDVLEVVQEAQCCGRILMDSWTSCAAPLQGLCTGLCQISMRESFESRGDVDVLESTSMKV